MVRVDSSGEEATDTLAAVLAGNAQPNLRRLAARQLARMGARTRRVVPQLVAALADDDEKVRRSAADALTAAGEKAVPELVKQLEAKDRQTRLLVITTLARLGTGAKAAIQPLMKCLNDSDEEVRRAAKMAINEINFGRP
jgi:HEAT repeat protein